MNKKCEILYMKGNPIISETEGDEDDEDEEDIWDDRKLNDAYDKAIRIANAEVAKRVAMSTNTAPREESKNPKVKGKQSSKNAEKKECFPKWKVGMPCRAKYEADGLEYEAFVMRIISDTECVVKFLGYENSEIVALSSLKPTKGSEERTHQIAIASRDREDDDLLESQSQIDNTLEGSQHPTLSPDKSYQNPKKSKKKKKAQRHMNGFDLPDIPMPTLSMLRNMGGMDMPIPPPPPITLHSNSNDTEDQAVSSMLLSWYMSGYYTGLYQGLKRSRSSRGNM